MKLYNKKKKWKQNTDVSIKYFNTISKCFMLQYKYN